jgi:hypothetical protein
MSSDPSSPPKFDPTLPRNKTELLGRIRRKWDELDKSVHAFNGAFEQAVDPGGWSVKDHLAHIGTWERVLSQHYFHHQPVHRILGMDETVYRRSTEDDLNAFIQASSQNLTIAQVFAAVREAHGQVLEDLEKASFEDLLQPQPDLPGTENLLLYAVVWNTYEHYREHRLTIDQIRHAGHNG